MAAENDLLDPAKDRQAMLALADLAEECGAFPALREAIRHAARMPVEGWIS